jgi:hypothetical protein
MEQEDDVGSEPDLGVGVLAMDGQEFVALGVLEREHLGVPFVRGE